MNTTHRRTAILEAQALLKSNPIYLDTETTGLHPTAEVIEIGIVDDQANILFEQRIRPRGRIDPVAERMHGISLAELADAPTWEQVWPQAELVLANRMVGVYNVEFDLRLIKQSLIRTWLKWTLPDDHFFDIMQLYARFFGEWDPFRKTYRYQALEMAGRQCQIPLHNTHGAIDDSLLARALLHHMAEYEG